ncbi:MAG: cob(I)yrinic acid a,c-diamide adenosyltransferase [Verrucomicrobia bacterium]|nr:cob(I)yrinic acid a,c-diamide adenosyltransferase [Verrucomicrobiota bacterium]
MIQFYVGDGKGKTTAAIGLAVRALGAALRVAIVQFDKGEAPDGPGYSERRVLDGLDGLTLIATGRDRRNPDGSFRTGNTDDDYREARHGLEVVARLLDNGRHDLIVCDELLSCLTTGLLERRDVEAILDQHGGREHVELVLTGRCNDEALLARADLITEMRNIKHYYDAGVEARRGYDY